MNNGKTVKCGTIYVHVLLLFWRSHRKHTMNKNKMFIDEYRYHLDGDNILAIGNRSVAGKSLFSRKRQTVIMITTKIKIAESGKFIKGIRQIRVSGGLCESTGRITNMELLKKEVHLPLSLSLSPSRSL